MRSSEASYNQWGGQQSSVEDSEREAVLREAGLAIRIPPANALAMKADLGLPWAEISK